MIQGIERVKGGMAIASASLAFSIGSLAANSQPSPAFAENGNENITAEKLPITDPLPKDPADKLREQLAKERADWHAERKRLLIRAAAKRPTEMTAIRLAHATFGVPINGLLALGSCESGQDANARNPHSIGRAHATGWSQIAYNPDGNPASTWHTTPYANLSPTDLTTNIMAAGFIWWRNDGKSSPGFGEWRDYCTRRADAASVKSFRVTFQR